jgi:Flp pilus assembly protein TadG
MLKNIRSLSALRNERGVTLIFVALILIVLLGIAALALDIGHLFVTKNELQNAADAGALAGARNLYNDDGTAVNSGCNAIAAQAAQENLSEKEAVEVTINMNIGDVQRGHWIFATREFKENPSLALSLFGVVMQANSTPT